MLYTRIADTSALNFIALRPMPHHYEKKWSFTSECIIPIPRRTRVVPISLYRKMQSFAAILKFDPHFCVFNGIIQTILVAFSTKTSRACTGMLSYENNVSEFLKAAKNIQKQVHYSSGARGTVLSLETSLSLTRNLNVNVAIELYYVFSKILKTFH